MITNKFEKLHNQLREKFSELENSFYFNSMQFAPLPKYIPPLFIGAFEKYTLPELEKIKPAITINKYLRIRKEYLQELIDIGNLLPVPPKYIQISLVQIPTTFPTTYGDAANHAENLYFFYTLADASRVKITSVNWYDLSSNNTSKVLIADTDADSCIAEFNGSNGNIDNFRRGLLEVVKAEPIPLNTERIFVDIKKISILLESDTLNQIEYFALLFCQVDEFEPHIITYYSTQLKDNNKHFAVLWKAEDSTFSDIPLTSIYDINELCPNIC